MKTLSPRQPICSRHGPSHSTASSAEWLNPLYALERTGKILLVWQARVRDREHLAQLDPHLRRDMGLTDAQIAEEIRKPFWIA